MPALSQAQLLARARAMLVAMTACGRWIYALPRAGAHAQVLAIARRRGLRQVEADEEASVVKLATGAADQRLVVLDSASLHVLLLEGSGGAVVPLLQEILAATGFVPQSRLWQGALQLGTPGAGRALTTLAHMVVAWDEDWIDLFLLHLASPDAVVRHDATLALSLAAMVSRDAAPALDLLREARRRETFPRLRETMAQAHDALQALAATRPQATPR